MNSLDFKGFQIDEETEAPGRFVIYDPCLGGYIIHPPVHSIEEAQRLIELILEAPEKWEVNI